MPAAAAPAAGRPRVLFHRRRIQQGPQKDGAIVSLSFDDLEDDATLQPSIPLHRRIANIPLFIFYRYLWRRDKPLLLATFFVNYFLPIILELLPWYFSKRKLYNHIRGARINIQHNMATGGEFSAPLVVNFAATTLWHALMDAFLRQLNTRVQLANRFVVRRMVMERLLYSEIGAFDRLRTSDLETRISADISQTMSLFNYTIPAMFGAAYSLYRESQDLYANRAHVDPLAVLRPTLFGLGGRLLSWSKYYLFDRQQDYAMRTNESNMTRFVSNALEGLSEIQINNLQASQLDLLGRMVSDEMGLYGWGAVFTQTWNAISNRNLFDFCSEVFVVHHVMKRRNLTHEQYRKIQNDVDHVLNIGFRLSRLVRTSYNILSSQARVVALLTMPSFEDEQVHLEGAVRPFESLRVARVQFRYADNLPLALDFQGELVIRPGKKYALVGQNRSGKSTLTNILCKLYRPDNGELYVNSTPYSQIARVHLRRLIAYVSQRPFIFPGTIRENILVGNPEATDEQVVEAALRAGVFAFGAGHRDQSSARRRPAGPPKRRPFMPGVEFGSAMDVDADDLVDDHQIDPPGSEPLSPAASVSSEGFVTPPGLLSPHSETGAGPYCSEHREFAFTDSLLCPPTRAERRAGCVVCNACGPVPELPRELQDPSKGEGLANNLKSASGILDMELNARGTNISGGFAQSVALARVFLRQDARILILDEAMGQMDAYKKRETILPRLLEWVDANNMALIVVSHDMAIVQHVDEVLLLDQGRLVAQGPHERLLRTVPEYVRLLG